MKYFIIASLMVVSTALHAQNVGIGTNTPDASARLDISATDKGLLVPRVNIPLLKAAAPVTNPATGLIVFNTNTSTGPGLVHWSGTEWLPIAEPDEVWLTAGNTYTGAGLPLLGTKNNKPLVLVMNDVQSGYIDSTHTFLGLRAGVSNAAGYNNIAIGNGALELNESGNRNVAIGSGALAYTIDKTGLVAIGDSALHLNGQGASTSSEATQNTAVGYRTLRYNTTGSFNTALGYSALARSTTGDFNVAVGHGALSGNSVSTNNVAIGGFALSQSSCVNSIAIGTFALMYNRAKDNVAIGDSALFFNSIFVTDPLLSVDNLAVGAKALWNNQMGNANLAIGKEALANNIAGNSNLAIGKGALYNNVSGINNIAIGYQSGSVNKGNNNVFIGHGAGQNAQSNNRLYIENSTADSMTALIYGDFGGDSLLLNAKTVVRNLLGVRGNASNTGIELGYGVAGKEVNAGRIGYSIFTPNALDIVGGGTLASIRVIHFWAEGGSRFAGKIIPDADNAFTLGESGRRWSAVWAANGTIQTSDANLKTNIEQLPYGLNEVLRMNPVQYNWKEDPTGKKEVGFLAQQMQTIIPEAVVNPGNGDPMGMKYNEIIPVLTRAIQQQQQQIEQLKTELEKLKAAQKNN